MKPFSLLVKPVAADCNLECRYCFYKKVKEIYPGNATRMTESTLEILLRKYLEMNFDVSSLCFQGGEPLLMDMNFYSLIPDLFDRYANNGQTLEISFQTNAVSITREWTRLFSLLHALVGVSLDGPKSINDAYRINDEGNGTFIDIMNGIDCLREDDIPFNILAMITNKSIGNADSIYKFYLNENFKWIQFIPCVEVDPHTNKLSSHSITSEEFGRFYSSLFDMWFENGYPDVSIRLFEDILFYLVDGVTISCNYKEKCDGYLLIEHNGDVYPCDFFVNSKWKIGNINNDSFPDLLTKPLRTKFMNLKSSLALHCRDCRYFDLCHGGCAKHYLHPAIFNKIPNHLCSGFYRFLDYTYSRFLEIREDIIRRRNAE